MGSEKFEHTPDGGFEYTFQSETIMEAIERLHYIERRMGREPYYLVLSRRAYLQLKFEVKQQRGDDYEIKEYRGMDIVLIDGSSVLVKLGTQP